MRITLSFRFLVKLSITLQGQRRQCGVGLQRAKLTTGQEVSEVKIMEPIVISPNDLWQVVLAISGGIITLSGAGAVIAGVIHKAKTPNQRQNERLDALEENVAKIEERLKLGNKRFESDACKMDGLESTMKNTNKIIVESLQALTAHAIDGNNIEQLRQAEKSLNNYLIDKI